VAQLGLARLLGVQEVVGSNPAGPTGCSLLQQRSTIKLTAVFISLTIVGWYIQTLPMRCELAHFSRNTN
jgi:hypothetical protein